MKILVVSPDYASHYFPLAALARALEVRGHETVFATGPALAGRVRGDGFEHHELVLGPGNNPGLIRADAQPGDEGARLEAFLEATRRGMVATLFHQAEARERDLLWRPHEVTERLAGILDDVRPDAVVSDQLAFGATLALRALRRPFVSFHPGHPSAIPGPGELYGFPDHRPPEFTASSGELERLRELCASVSRRFTQAFNEALLALDPAAPPVDVAIATTSDVLTLLNYPRELVVGGRRFVPPSARFIGAAVRPWVTAPVPPLAPLPRIYVSLGSFLSGRSDVLRRIVAAFRDHPVELVIASGVTPPSELGETPPHWRVEPYLPQPQLLRSVDLVVCHGGNNTVTEALWAGVPLLVAPFSTDQFAGAEDVRRGLVGDVFDPNVTPPEEIRARAGRILASRAPARAAMLGERLRATHGAALGARLIEGAAGRLAPGRTAHIVGRLRT